MKRPTFFPQLLAIASAALLVHNGTSAAAQESPGPATSAASAVPAIRLSPGVEDVLKLSRAKVGDDVIAAFVHDPGRRYNLTADEIVYLRKEGLSDRVLAAMVSQSSRRAAATPAPQPVAPGTATPSAPLVGGTQSVGIPTTPSYQTPPDYTPAPVPATYVASEPTTYSYPYYGYSYPYYGYSYPYYGYSYPYYGYSYPAFSLGFAFGTGCGYPYYGGYNCRYPYYGGYYCGNGYKNGYYYANGNKGGYYRGGQPVNNRNNGNYRNTPDVRRPGGGSAGNTLTSLPRPSAPGGVGPVRQGLNNPGIRSYGGSFRSGGGGFSGMSSAAPRGGGNFASFSAPRGGGGRFSGMSGPAPRGGGNFASFSGPRGGGGGGGFARGGGGGGRR
jgi:hypothetical protein